MQRVTSFVLISVLASFVGSAGCLKHAAPASAHTATTSKAPQQTFSPLLADVTQKHKLVGMCAALIDPAQPDRTACVGRRRIDRPTELEPHDLFHLGSDTKAFTATLAAILVEGGRLRWDSTLAEAFPERTMHKDLRVVTLADLLTHRGGIAGTLEGPLTNMVAELWARTDDLASQRRWLVEQILGMAPAKPPRTAFLYSNQGYVLAGAMLEKVSGVAWEELIRTRIFRPLDMKSCGFGAPQNTSADAPFGHHRSDDGALEVVPAGVQADNPAAMGPAGTIHCSLEDWGRFLKQHLIGESGASTLLSAESWNTLHAPPPFAAPESGPDYAMGWLVVLNPKTGARAFTHAGSNTTFYAETWLFPATGRGYMVALNQADQAGQDAANEVIIGLFELEPPLPKPDNAASPSAAQ